MTNQRQPARASSLFIFLCLGYVAFIALASLYPFLGWRVASPDFFGYLAEPLDFQTLNYNKLDILFNLLAYIPLGALLSLTLQKRSPILLALFAVVLSCALSLVMEGAQSYLPSRRANTFDVIWNGGGALLGALLMTPPRLRKAARDGLQHWRDRLFESGRLIEAGLILMLGWFLAQWVPECGLFAVGDLELLFPTQHRVEGDATFFIGAEAAVCAINMLALGMICRHLFRTHLPRLLALSIFLMALLFKTLGFALYFGVSGALAWFTPGAKYGLLIGSAVFLTASFLPQRWQFYLGGLSLSLGAVLVNFLPMNPYISETIRTWRPGSYATIAGIARLIAVFWPFLMLSYLYFYRRLRPTSLRAQAR